MFDSERHVIENRQAAERLGQPAQRDRCHASSLSTPIFLSGCGACLFNVSADLLLSLGVFARRRTVLGLKAGEEGGGHHRLESDAMADRAPMRIADELD